MHIILLSGGSGRRLWPLSNDVRSKQFLKLLSNESNQLESMVQRVWSQLSRIGLSEHTFITTNNAQRDIIQNQLGKNTRLIVEPERRDTFAAIALACAYLHTVEGLDPTEVVTFLPVDPHVSDEFFRSIYQLESVLQTSGADIALIGAKPSYPSEKYGYIIPSGDNQYGYNQVKGFKEKPTVIEAMDLLSKAALWNCGVFAFRLEFMLTFLSEIGLSLDYNELNSNYGSLSKISFDYAVLEKTPNLVVIPYNGDWKDLGTWNTLTDEMSGNQIGNGIISDDSENVHIINELDIPVVALGLNDLVIAASPDGILVSSKSASPRVKDVIDFNNRPMYEERRWGWHKVLDYARSENAKEVVTKRVHLSAGKNLSYHTHHWRTETWTIISGTGEVFINGCLTFVQAGSVFIIEPDIAHAIRAITDLEFIEIQSGDVLSEVDVIRLHTNWNEIVMIKDNL